MRYYVVTTYKTDGYEQQQHFDSKVAEFASLGKTERFPSITTVDDTIVVKRRFLTAGDAEEWATLVNTYFSEHPEIAFFVSSEVVTEDAEPVPLNPPRSV